MALEKEALNVIAPIQNTMGVRAMVRFGVTPTCNPTLYKYLPSYFGGYGEGGYYTVKMDSPDDTDAKAYVCLAPDPSGTIDPRTVGGGTDICWPMNDGDEEHWRVPYVRQRQAVVKDANGNITGPATSVATHLPTVLAYNWLKVVGSLSCYVTIRRSSLPEGGDAGEWRFPDGE